MILSYSTFVSINWVSCLMGSIQNFFLFLQFFELKQHDMDISESCTLIQPDHPVLSPPILPVPQDAHQNTTQCQHQATTKHHPLVCRDSVHLQAEQSTAGHNVHGYSMVGAEYVLLQVSYCLVYLTWTNSSRWHGGTLGSSGSLGKK